MCLLTGWPAMFRRAGPLLLTLAIGLTSACTGTGADVRGGGCTTDTDCDGNMKCFDGRVCIQTSLHDWNVIMRISPGPNSGLVEEHFETTIGGEQPQPRTWQLTRPAQVRGTVRLAPTGAKLSELIPGTLIATAPGKLAATQLRYTASSSLNLLSARDDAGADRGGADPENGGGAPVGGRSQPEKWAFELHVQPGQTYAVAFWPQSKALPPHYETRTIGGDVGGLAIVLPTAPDVIEVTGQLVSRAVNAPCDAVTGPQEATGCDAGCSPLPLLDVALLDAKGRTRSTIATTAADGTFSIKADLSAEHLWLHFGPAIGAIDQAKALTTDQQRALSLPSGTFTAAINTVALRKAAVATLALGEQNIGPLPAHQILNREVLGDDGLELAGAHVEVRQPLPAPSRCDVKEGGGYGQIPAIKNFELRRSQISDSDGKVTLRTLLSPGTIAVKPPAHDSAARWTQTVELLSPTAEKIRCGTRRKVKGRVEYLGKLVHGATIHIQPLPATDNEALNSGPIAADLAPIFATSNDEGRYAAWLDPGRYVMIVEPPTDSGLARTLSAIIDITPTSKADSAVLERDLAVWPPTVLHGQLLGVSGKPQPGVLIDVLGKDVQLLKSVFAADSPPIASALRAMIWLQTHRLGSAVTDQDGRFEVLVAPGNLSE